MMAPDQVSATCKVPEATRLPSVTWASMVVVTTFDPILISPTQKNTVDPVTADTVRYIRMDFILRTTPISSGAGAVILIVQVPLDQPVVSVGGLGGLSSPYSDSQVYT